MSAPVDVLAWRIVGPVPGSGSGWIDAKERQPPFAHEVHANGCRLELLTGSVTAVAELVEAALHVADWDDFDLSEVNGLLSDVKKLRAALAKFGGAK